MRALLISGYRSYELQIYRENEPKLFFLKQLLTQKLVEKIEAGFQWFVITGQLGVELWTGELVIQLKEEYPDIRLAILTPYENMTSQWNTSNQSLFQKVCSGADYVRSTSQKNYESPKQLQANQVFIIQNTQGALLLHDTMQPGKTKYLYELIKKYQEEHIYDLEVINFEQLDWFVHLYQEEHPDGLKDL